MLQNPRYAHMMEEADWYYVPMVNVDGYVETWNGVWYLKICNRNNNLIEPAVNIPPQDKTGVPVWRRILNQLG